MKARHLIDSASYGPDALKTMGQAFEEAWRDIGGNFGHDPRDIELARERLAKALLSAASEENRDVEALKSAASQVMALDCRERSMKLTKSNLGEIAIAALVIIADIGFFTLQYMVAHHGKLPFVG
jgi:hypothetical protein